MGCDEATYLAAALIFVEYSIRFSSCCTTDVIAVDAFPSTKDVIFIVFFILSMSSTMAFVLFLHKWSIFKNATVQQCLPFLYMIDSIGATCLGYSLYTDNNFGVTVSMLLLTNFLMLHVLHGVFSGKTHNNMVRILEAMCELLLL